MIASWWRRLRGIPRRETMGPVPPPPDYQALFASEAQWTRSLTREADALRQSIADLEAENDRLRTHLAALLRDFPAHRE